MNKEGTKRIVILVAAALLVALFAVFLFLSVPLGGRASVLPITAFYVAGGVVAGLFLVAAAVFSFRSR